MVNEEIVLHYSPSGQFEAPKKPKHKRSAKYHYPGLLYEDQLLWYKMISSCFDETVPFLPADGQAIYDCSNVYSFEVCYYLHLLLSEEKEEEIQKRFAHLEQICNCKAVPIYRKLRRIMMDIKKSIPKSSEETINNVLSWIPMFFDILECLDEDDEGNPLEFQPVQRNSIVKSIIRPGYDFQAHYHSDRIIIVDHSFLKKSKFKKFICGVSQFDKHVIQDVMGLIVKGTDIFLMKSGEGFQIFGKLEATNTMDMAFLCTAMLSLHSPKEVWALSDSCEALIEHLRMQKKKTSSKECKNNEMKNQTKRPQWK